MAKAHLTFNLDDPDDREQFRYAIKGQDAMFALDEIRNQIRRWEKNDFEPSLEDVKDMFFAALDLHDIEI